MRFFIARDGGEAPEILEYNVPDVVLLDIMMLQVDGYQTLKWMKNNKALSDIKVIFLTAKNKGLGDEVAIYYDSPVSDTKLAITYTELLYEVGTLAGGLRDLGVKRGYGNY